MTASLALRHGALSDLDVLRANTVAPHRYNQDLNQGLGSIVNGKVTDP